CRTRNPGARTRRLPSADRCRDLGGAAVSITPDMLRQQKAALRPTPKAPVAPKPPIAAKPPGTIQNAKIGVAGTVDPDEQVEFAFNPAAIVIQHTASVAPSAGKSPDQKDGSKQEGGPPPTNPGDIIATNVEEREKARGTTIITLRGMVFDGRGV